MLRFSGVYWSIFEQGDQLSGIQHAPTYPPRISARLSAGTSIMLWVSY